MTIDPHPHRSARRHSTASPEAAPAAGPSCPAGAATATVFDALLPVSAPHRRTVATDLREHGESPRTGRTSRSPTSSTTLVAPVDALGVDTGHPRRPLARRLGGGRAASAPRRRARARHGSGRLDGARHAARLRRRPRRPPGRRGVGRGARGLSSDVDPRGSTCPRCANTLPPWVSYGAPTGSGPGREIAACFAAKRRSAGGARRAASRARPCTSTPSRPTTSVLAAQQALADTHAWFEVHRLDARSHFPMFEVPDEMARLVEEFACRLH